MASVTADYDGQRKALGGYIQNMPLAASQTIYAGTMVCTDSTTGTIKDGADSANFSFAGVSCEYMTSTSGSLDYLGNAAYVQVFVAGDFLFTAVSGAATDVGKPAYLVYNTTVQTAPTSNNIYVGIVSQYISSTQLRVRIG